MPTNQNAYNSRVTDEALEKRFRDTFRSQGGAELVDDLYASGVIVPVVDFTAAAQGTTLDENLQTAWDFSTGLTTVTASTPQTIITTSGFWQIDLILSGYVVFGSAGTFIASVDIFDGTTFKPVWELNPAFAANSFASVLEDKFVVYLRSGDSLRAKTGTASTDQKLTLWYRQIADVSGNLINPTGFTSS